MFHRNFAVFAAGLAVLASGCDRIDFDTDGKNLAEGKTVSTEWTEIAAFSKVAARGPDNVVVETGDTFQIKATGDSANIAKLRYTLKDGTLIVGRAKEKWRESAAVTITITAPTLSSVSIAGSGDVKAAKLSGEHASVSVAGSGDADVAEVVAETLKMSIAGSGNAKLSGKVGKADYSIAGSGDAKINATGTVEAKIAGSGNILVTGGGKCTSSVAGSGKINCP
jgi:Putative auto-transporter adhesin, head GIN domain